MILCILCMHDFSVCLFNPAFRGCQNPINGLWRILVLYSGSTVKISNFWKSKMAAAAILKTVKSPYLCNRLTDFGEIWRYDAYSSPTADRPLKFWIFENSRWRQPPFWKITKIAIYLQRFDRSLRNLVCWCRMGLSTASAVKKIRISEFQDGGRPPF